MGWAVAGWLVGLAVIAVFVTWMLVRGRHLGREVPPERRRWL